MRLTMAILTGVWILALMACYALSYGVVNDPHPVDVLVSVQALSSLSFVSSWLWFAGLPLLVIGWGAEIVRCANRREGLIAVPTGFIPRDPRHTMPHDLGVVHPKGNKP